MKDNSERGSTSDPGPLILGREPIVLPEERKKALTEIKRRVDNVRE